MQQLSPYTRFIHDMLLECFGPGNTKGDNSKILLSVGMCQAAGENANDLLVAGLAYQVYAGHIPDKAKHPIVVAGLRHMIDRARMSPEKRTLLKEAVENFATDPEHARITIDRHGHRADHDARSILGQIMRNLRIDEYGKEKMRILKLAEIIGTNGKILAKQKRAIVY